MRLFAIIALLFLTSVIAFAATDSNVDSNATVPRWQWLKGTTWYVPRSPPLTGFFLLNGQTVSPVVDQTLY
ncbi:MAG TPA: hypothetical protein VE687_18720 [Stellaceae bacterium]|nr:hypothetical protein [Stellaceae bacterium]